MDVSRSSEGNFRFFKAWKAGRGGRLAAHNKAKKVCSCTIHHAKREAEKVALDKIGPRMLGIYQRTNGPVNAHLISWPSKAQNIQNLENIW